MTMRRGSEKWRCIFQTSQASTIALLVLFQVASSQIIAPVGQEGYGVSQDGSWVNQQNNKKTTAELKVLTSADSTCVGKDCVGRFELDLEIPLTAGSVQSFRYKPVGSPDSDFLIGTISIPFATTVVNLVAEYFHPTAGFCGAYAGDWQTRYAQMTQSGKKNFFTYCTTQSGETPALSENDFDFTFSTSEFTTDGSAKDRCKGVPKGVHKIRYGQAPVVLGNEGMAVYSIDERVVLVGLFCMTLDKTYCTEFSSNEAGVIEFKSGNGIKIDPVSINAPTKVTGGSIVAYYSITKDGIETKGLKFSRSGSRTDPMVSGALGEFQTVKIQGKGEQKAALTAYNFQPELPTSFTVEGKSSEVYGILEFFGDNSGEGKEWSSDGQIYSGGGGVLVLPMEGVSLRDSLGIPNGGTASDADERYSSILIWVVAGLIITGVTLLTAWLKSPGNHAQVCNVKRTSFNPQARMETIYNNLESAQVVFGGEGLEYSKTMVKVNGEGVIVGTSFNLTTLESQTVKLKLTSTGMRLSFLSETVKISGLSMESCTIVEYGVGSNCLLKFNYEGPANNFRLSGNVYYLSAFVPAVPGVNSRIIGFRAPLSQTIVPEACLLINGNVTCVTGKVASRIDRDDRESQKIDGGSSDPSGSISSSYYHVLFANKGFAATWIIVVIVGSLLCIVTIMVMPRYFSTMYMMMMMSNALPGSNAQMDGTSWPTVSESGEGLSMLVWVVAPISLMCLMWVIVKMKDGIEKRGGKGVWGKTWLLIMTIIVICVKGDCAESGQIGVCARTKWVHGVLSTTDSNFWSWSGYKLDLNQKTGLKEVIHPGDDLVMTSTGTNYCVMWMWTNRGPGIGRQAWCGLNKYKKPFCSHEKWDRAFKVDMRSLEESMNTYFIAGANQERGQPYGHWACVSLAFGPCTGTGMRAMGFTDEDVGIKINYLALPHTNWTCTTTSCTVSCPQDAPNCNNMIMSRYDNGTAHFYYCSTNPCTSPMSPGVGKVIGIGSYELQNGNTNAQLWLALASGVDAISAGPNQPGKPRNSDGLRPATFGYQRMETVMTTEGLRSAQNISLTCDGRYYGEMGWGVNVGNYIPAGHKLAPYPQGYSIVGEGGWWTYRPLSEEGYFSVSLVTRANWRTEQLQIENRTPFTQRIGFLIADGSVLTMELGVMETQLMPNFMESSYSGSIIQMWPTAYWRVIGTDMAQYGRPDGKCSTPYGPRDPLPPYTNFGGINPVERLRVAFKTPGQQLALGMMMNAAEDGEDGREMIDSLAKMRFSQSTTTFTGKKMSIGTKQKYSIGSLYCKEDEWGSAICSEDAIGSILQNMGLNINEYEPENGTVRDAFCDNSSCETTYYWYAKMDTGGYLTTFGINSQQALRLPASCVGNCSGIVMRPKDCQLPSLLENRTLGLSDFSVDLLTLNYFVVFSSIWESGDPDDKAEGERCFALQVMHSANTNFRTVSSDKYDEVDDFILNNKNCRTIVQSAGFHGTDLSTLQVHCYDQTTKMMEMHLFTAMLRNKRTPEAGAAKVTGLWPCSDQSFQYAVVGVSMVTPGKLSEDTRAAFERGVISAIAGFTTGTVTIDLNTDGWYNTTGTVLMSSAIVRCQGKCRVTVEFGEKLCSTTISQYSKEIPTPGCESNSAMGFVGGRMMTVGIGRGTLSCPVIGYRLPGRSEQYFMGNCDSGLTITGTVCDWSQMELVSAMTSGTIKSFMYSVYPNMYVTRYFLMDGSKNECKGTLARVDLDLTVGDSCVVMTTDGMKNITVGFVGEVMSEGANSNAARSLHTSSSVAVTKYTAGSYDVYCGSYSAAYHCLKVGAYPLYIAFWTIWTIPLGLMIVGKSMHCTLRLVKRRKMIKQLAALIVMVYFGKKRLTETQEDFIKTMSLEKVRRKAVTCAEKEILKKSKEAKAEVDTELWKNMKKLIFDIEDRDAEVKKKDGWFRGSACRDYLTPRWNEMDLLKDTLAIREEVVAEASDLVDSVGQTWVRETMRARTNQMDWTSSKKKMK